VSQYIPDRFVEEVQQGSDIVAVISEYVPLKRKGKDYVCLCPFHSEKTPSFSVSPSKQIFKCFGCGAGGNVFSFVMAYEKIGFVEAVEILARKLGMSFEKQKPQPGEVSSTSLKKVNAWAARTYHDLLLSDKGAEARRYLEERTFTEATIKRLQLGYAPGKWDTLVQLATSQGAKSGLLEKAGLAIASQDRETYYDRFRNRLIFPIVNPRGDVIGFGGRSLDGSEPKYLNSPETPLFKKSDALFGFGTAREAIRETDRAAVVEGYTDCVMAQQLGVNWVVATLGTSLTPQHVRTLRRLTDHIVLVFDGDEAGRKAADRSVELLVSELADVRVVLLPEGCDPYDYLVEHGAKAFVDRIDEAVDAIDFKIEYLKERYDFSSVADKTRAVKVCADLVGTLLLACKDPVKSDLIVREFAAKLDVSVDALRAELQRRNRPVRRKEQGQASLDSTKIAEIEIIQSLIHEPLLVQKAEEEAIEFSDPDTAAIYGKICELYHRKNDIDYQGLLNSLENTKLTSFVTDIVEGHIGGRKKTGHEEQFRGALAFLVGLRKRKRYAELKQLFDKGNAEDMLEFARLKREIGSPDK